MQIYIFISLFLFLWEIMQDIELSQNVTKLYETIIWKLNTQKAVMEFVC